MDQSLINLTNNILTSYYMCGPVLADEGEGENKAEKGPSLIEHRILRGI